MSNEQNFIRYKERRDALRERVEQAHGSGVIMLCAAIEPHTGRFRQDKNFYYYTGLQEPGAVLLLYPDDTSELFVPFYNGVRSLWVEPEVVADDARASLWLIDKVSYLGQQEKGYALSPFRSLEQYKHLIHRLQEQCAVGADLQVIGLPNCYSSVYAEQLAFLVQRELRLSQDAISMINAVVAQQRREKDAYEISCIKKAIDLTKRAQIVVRDSLHDGVAEYQLRAKLEGAMVEHGAKHLAFPSIVATGKNATILHYTKLDSLCKNGDLVVVDIGAEYAEYASDITRTWSVGTSSDRACDLAKTVKEIQSAVAAYAKPGIPLRKKECDASLEGYARKLLAQKGLGHAMPHSIGHFMGLDVHDVGDAHKVLAPGDVITIEPGVYLPDEGIGIRIEDNYLITEDGAQCLSSDIPGEW